MSLFFSRRPGRRPGVVGGALLGLLAAPTVTLAQMPDAGTSEVHEAEMATVEAGPFDNGKMWTFEYPPSGYFQEAYDLTPDEAWWAKARTAALRIPSCSASLVSPNGLVMTNHHCAREFVSQVSREGETLLDQGFYATSLEEERSVEDFTADQLIDIVDVTDEVYAALEGIEDNQARSARREEITEEIAARIREERGGEDASIDVEMISLWNGARYSAYVFKQYTEVKLVMAPELQIGFFGGDPDNFTFPRYNLDMSFFRIYEDGQPLQTDTYFEWDDDGVVEGEPIFIIGNPGSTSRLQTVAELEFRRDAADAGVLAFVRSRAELLEEFTAAHPEVAETLDLRNEAFSLRNSEKAYGGILRGLSDPAIIARRADSERRFQEAIEANPELATEYGGLIERLAELQDQKRPEAGGYFAFLGMTAPKYASATLRRALYGFQYLQMQGRVSEEALEEVKNEFLAVEQLPPELDEALIRARIEDLQLGYGEDAPFLQEMLAARTPEGLAAIVHQSSVLSDSAGAVAALENGMLSMADPALEFFAGFLRPFGAFQTVLAQTGPEEEEIAARGVRHGCSAGRHLLAAHRGWRRDRLRVQRHTGPHPHHFLWAVRPALFPRGGRGVGTAGTLAQPARHPRSFDAGQLRRHGRHHRRQLGISGAGSGPTGGRSRLRRQHREPAGRLHLPARARQSIGLGGCPRHSGRTRSRIRRGPARRGAHLRAVGPDGGGSGRDAVARPVSAGPVGSVSPTNRRPASPFSDEAPHHERPAPGRARGSAGLSLP
jgi:hypothetical protein